MVLQCGTMSCTTLSTFEAVPCVTHGVYLCTTAQRGLRIPPQITGSQHFPHSCPMLVAPSAHHTWVEKLRSSAHQLHLTVDSDPPAPPPPPIPPIPGSGGWAGGGQAVGLLSGVQHRIWQQTLAACWLGCRVRGHPPLLACGWAAEVGGLQAAGVKVHGRGGYMELRGWLQGEQEINGCRVSRKAMGVVYRCGLEAPQGCAQSHRSTL